MIRLLACLVVLLVPVTGGAAMSWVETPSLREAVAEGRLPPVAERLPGTPQVARFDHPEMEIGRHGGTIRMLMAKPQETRQVSVFGYARLIGYDHRLELVPDILESYEVEEGRIFTLRLRPGHRWSDGHPFTSEDFRFWWEDVANEPALSPSGPPVRLRVDGEPPEVTFPDAHTVRFAWSRPNPEFLPALAGARPLQIFAPAHYLKRFHARHADPEALAAAVADANRRNWAALFHSLDSAYDADNPDLPTLAPWVATTPPPAERFTFRRNPFYHRVDPEGRQLPYADEIVVQVTSSRLIPAKAGSGEADLQARYIVFDNISFLKQNETRADFRTLLWRTGKGAQIALYPNLNAEDPVWRAVLRDVRFRRALSLGIDRHEINQVVYYGFAYEGGNGVLPASPLFDRDLFELWSRRDVVRADALLDEMGLARGDDGIRRLPDGRPLAIVVETAGENSEEADALELIHDHWLEIGVKLHTKPMQREVLRSRVFSGKTVMAVWSGLENGLARPDMSPAELAPTAQIQLQWPQWGLFHESRGTLGAAIDDPAAARLMELYGRWREAPDRAARADIWRRMLRLHAEQQFSIGIVSGVLQPVVVANALRNVPAEGNYNWDPGAFFGSYRPDRFWFDRGGEP